MKGVTKVHPPDKRIVTDLYLSFLPGAKIGVIGPNGMGKSTLLRIMAGEDTTFNGEAWLPSGGDRRLRAAGAGHRPRPDRQGRASRRPSRRSRTRSRDSRRVSMKLGEVTERRRDERAARASRASCRTRSTRPTAGTSTTRSSWRWTRCGCRRPTRASTTSPAARSAASRSAATLLQKPDLLLLDEPTNHLDAESVAWLEQHLAQYPGTIVAITHDRYFLDNVAEWILELDRGEAYPFKGNYTRVARGQGEAPRGRGEAGVRRQRKIKASSSGCALRPRPATPRARRASRRTRRWSPRAASKKRDANEIFIPPPTERLGDEGHRGARHRQGLRRQAALRGSRPSASRAAPSSASSARTAPARRRSSGMITGQEKPDDGRDRRRRDRAADVRRPEPRRARRGQDGLRGDQPAARTRSWSARPRSPRAPTSGSSTSRAATSRRRSACSRGGERNRVHLAKTLTQGGNVLLLDEPTNDLDVETLALARVGDPRVARLRARSRATTAGSSTASPRTSSRSRATAAWSSSRARTTSTRRTARSASAPRRSSRTASSTASSPATGPCALMPEPRVGGSTTTARAAGSPGRRRGRLLVVALAERAHGSR